MCPDSFGIGALLRGAFIVWLTAAVIGCGDGGAPPPGAVEVGGVAAASAAVEVVDDVGREVRLDRPAARVISLVPSATETILALGAGATLVARTDYDEDPRLSDLPSVGGGLTPAIELLASLQPDLVIAWEEAGAARIRPRLEALGVPVYADQTRDTAGIYSAIDRLGHLLGRDAAADSLAAEIRLELDAVRESVRGLEPPSVVYLVSLDPPMAAGPRLYIGEMIEVAGGRNIFADLTAPSPQVSLEEIVARRPDVVLVPTPDGDGTAVLARLRNAPGWSALLATGTTRVEALPADLLHRPGPAIIQGVRALRDAIRPSAEERR